MKLRTAPVMAALLVSAGLALTGPAWSQATPPSGGMEAGQGSFVGTVVSVDKGRGEVTFDNGETYELPDKDVTGITPGNKMLIHWFLCGTERACDVAKVVTNE